MCIRLRDGSLLACGLGEKGCLGHGDEVSYLIIDPRPSLLRLLTLFNPLFVVLEVDLFEPRRLEYLNGESILRCAVGTMHASALTKVTHTENL